MEDGTREKGRKEGNERVWKRGQGRKMRSDPSIRMNKQRFLKQIQVFPIRIA